MKRQKVFPICKEKIKHKYLKGKTYCKVRDHCHYTGEYRGTVHNICNLKHSIPKKISIAFDNGSNYHHYFIRVSRRI